MGRVRQGISIKRAKNKNAKYRVTSTKYSYKKTTTSGTTKKYSYTRRITLANGRYKYYYA